MTKNAVGVFGELPIIFSIPAMFLIEQYPSALVAAYNTIMHAFIRVYNNEMV